MTLTHGCSKVPLDGVQGARDRDRLVIAGLSCGLDRVGGENSVTELPWTYAPALDWTGRRVSANRARRPQATPMHRSGPTNFAPG